MKKLMFAAAALAVGVAVADVTSANIVGYMTPTTVEDDFNMIAIPFYNVDGSGLDFNRDITVKGVATGEGAQECDFVHVYINSDGWYFLYNHHDELAPGQRGHMDDGWYTTDDEEIGDYFPDGFPVGTAMWYEAYADGERSEPLSITFSGEVEGAKSVTLENLAGDDFNMISNPYPVAWDPNNAEAVQFENVATGEGAQDCDFIHVYINGDGWYFLYNHHDELAPGQRGHMDDGWYTTDDEEIGDYFPDGIPAGTAMWYEAFGGADRAGDLGITFFSTIK